MAERLEGMLFEAASKGSVNSLQKILKEDPIILDRVTVNYLSETPLHVASLLGHVDFVKEIVRTKPQLTTELNLQQSSPLHLASAKGHAEVVKILISATPQTCLVRDRNGFVPLHLAAIKGHVNVMKDLLHKKKEAALLNVYGGENVLHLCVRYYQLEGLKLLVKTISDPGFMNARDADGNTVLHIAVACKQVETINFLLTLAAIEVNALNQNGMTPMDALFQSQNRDMRDLEIEQRLEHAGGFATMETITNTTPLQALSHHQTDQYLSLQKQKNNWEILFKQQDNWLERKKSSLMIVASLIATMAFQAGVNPPSGVWQDDKLVDSQGKNVSDPHRAGHSVMASNYPDRYIMFYIINTAGFISSLSIILLLISGLPIKRRFFMWILMVITWIAITATALTYVVTIPMLTPSEQDHSITLLVVYSTLAWLGLMALLLIGHTIRLFVRVVKKMVRMCFGRRRRRRTNPPRISA